MKSFIASLIALLCVTTASAQTSKVQTSTSGRAITNVQDPTSKTQVGTANTTTTSDLIKSTETAKNASQDLLKLQQEELAKQTASLAQLQELYSEGLIARVELEKAQQDLVDAKAKVEQTQNQIASANQLAAQIQKASEQAKLNKTKVLVKPVLKAINTTGATVMRSTSGNWSLSNLSQVQQFFWQTFGRALPVSTVGQSTTHNRMGWDHRNSVDVGIHPDSQEGQALMSYLQMLGIPFLAFRAAISGVSTGPHIHIGYPSHRLG